MLEPYFLTKQISVEAFQWEGNFEDVPLWVYTALDHSDPILHGKIIEVGKNLQVATAHGTKIAKVGDWVVYWRSTDHALEVMTDDEFHQRFVPNERRARLRGSREPKLRSRIISKE